MKRDGSQQDALEGDLKRLGGRFNSARETFWGKIVGIEQDLDPSRLIPDADHELRKRCLENVERARACCAKQRGHPNLAWVFLHRVDEDLLLLVRPAELKARALEVRTAFELNITEPSVRTLWLGTEGGDKGALVRAIESLGQDDSAREILRAALQMVNEQVDRRFWRLSANVLTSVWSGVLLAMMMVLYAMLWNVVSRSTFSALDALGQDVRADILPVIVLGAMGAFVSNLLTREDFLFIRGGPYWRYLLHPIVAKPVLSAFAAVFVYAMAQSSLIFSIGNGASASNPAIVHLSVSEGRATAFAYAILAVVSGFSADKLLRGMIDAVLKRLEQKAEKTAKSEEEKKS